MLPCEIENMQDARTKAWRMAAVTAAWSMTVGKLQCTSYAIDSVQVDTVPHWMWRTTQSPLINAILSLGRVVWSMCHGMNSNFSTSLATAMEKYVKNWLPKCINTIYENISRMEEIKSMWKLLFNWTLLGRWSHGYRFHRLIYEYIYILYILAIAM